MATEETNGRRLDDRIKVVVLGVIGGIILPMGGYLMSEVTKIKDDIANYKLVIAERFVQKRDYSSDIAEMKSLLREMRDEIRDHERISRETR